MTQLCESAQLDCSAIDIDELLTQRRQIAVIWGVEDVQHVRPDLNDDQAWEVLKECRDRHDCELGFTWDLIECVAGMLFPDLSESTEE
jgi:hypothetical protein